MTENTGPNNPEELDAELEAIIAEEVAELEAAEAEQATPKQYVIYPQTLVKDGQLAVSPELIDALLQDYLFDSRSKREGTHTEGDVQIRVNYDDLKHLIELSGGEVVEVKFPEVSGYATLDAVIETGTPEGAAE